MKITQVELEEIISEEIVNAIEEGQGTFSRLFNKGLQKLKTRNVAKQDKEMGIQRTSQGPEKEKPADKFMDNKTKKNVIRIAAEILSDIANINISKTKQLKKIDPESYGTAKARSKMDVVREEETLEEATPKEVKFHSNLINTAIKDGKVTLEGLLDDIISLSKTNPIVKAMVGVDQLVAQFDKAEEPAPQTSAEPEAPSEKGKMSAAEFADYMAAKQPQDPKRPTTIPKTSGQPAQTIGPPESPQGQDIPSPEEPGAPDITGAPPAKEISPEQERKAQEAADNIMGQIADAINQTNVSNKAKRKVRKSTSTEKIRQAIGREIRAGLQEQKIIQIIEEELNKVLKNIKE